MKCTVSNNGECIMGINALIMGNANNGECSLTSRHCYFEVCVSGLRGELMVGFI